MKRRRGLGLASVGVVCGFVCRRVAARGCVEECSRVSMENVLQDFGRWFVVVRWLGQRGRGVAGVGIIDDEWCVVQGGA